MENIAVFNVTVNLNAEQSWEKLRDFSTAHHYVPSIDTCEIRSEKKEGLTATRRVAGKHQALDETIIEWNEGKGFKITLHKGDKPAFPFKQAEFTYRIDPLDDKTSKMTTTLVYDLGMGIFGKILGALFLKGLIQNNIRDVALSLQNYYNTGQPTTDEDLKRIKKEMGI